MLFCVVVVLLLLIISLCIIHVLVVGGGLAGGRVTAAAGPQVQASLCSCVISLAIPAQHYWVPVTHKMSANTTIFQMKLHSLGMG